MANRQRSGGTPSDGGKNNWIASLARHLRDADAVVFVSVGVTPVGAWAWSGRSEILVFALGVLVLYVLYKGYCFRRTCDIEMGKQSIDKQRGAEELGKRAKSKRPNGALAVGQSSARSGKSVTRP